MLKVVVEWEKRSPSADCSFAPKFCETISRLSCNSTGLAQLMRLLRVRYYWQDVSLCMLGQIQEISVVTGHTERLSTFFLSSHRI